MIKRRWTSYFAIALLGTALAACSQPQQPATTASLEVLQSDTIHRQFVTAAPFGQVHLRRLGPLTPSQRPPVILLHPSPFSSDYFTTFMPYLAADRLVIAIDTAGFGQSDAPDTPQPLDQYALSVANALDALGLKAVDVIGYHTGSLLGAELAVQRPDLVRRLMLPGIPYQTGEKQKATFDRVVVAQPPKADGSHLDKHWTFASRRLKDGVSLERVQEQFADIMQSYPRNWWAYFGVFSYASEERMRQLRQPTLFITTSGSLRAETEAAAKVAPNSQLRHLGHLKHGIFEVASEELAALARGFFDAPEPGR